MRGPKHYSPEPPLPTGICWSTLRNTQLGLTRGLWGDFTSCMLKIPLAVLWLPLSAGVICLLIHTTVLLSGAVAGPGPNSANSSSSLKVQFPSWVEMCFGQTPCPGYSLALAWLVRNWALTYSLNKVGLENPKLFIQWAEKYKDNQPSRVHGLLSLCLLTHLSVLWLQVHLGCLPLCCFHLYEPPLKPADRLCYFQLFLDWVIDFSDISAGWGQRAYHWQCEDNK